MSQLIKAISAPLALRWNLGRMGDRLFHSFVFLMALAIFAIVLLLLFKLVDASSLAISRFGLGFLVDTVWDPVFSRFGALPFVYGTVLSSILALLIGVPISLGTAIFLAELCPPWLQRPLSFLVELLGAIPSVVYGLWGFLIMAPWLAREVEPLLGRTLGFLPFFQGPTYGVGMLAAGLILAVMVTPTIAAVSRDVIGAVPDTQREAMLALGSTRWEMIWHAVMPYARTGIFGAIILGLGRAVGETMAVTMVIGNRPDVSVSLFAPSYTIASVIANEFTEATYDLYLSSLVEMGLILFIVTIIINALARLMIWRIALGPVGGE